MNNKIKYLIPLSLILLLFQNIIYSHSFNPYSFVVSFPKNINAKIGDEIRINIVIKNIGLIGDLYEIYLIPSTNDIYVSSSLFNISLESSDHRLIPVTIVVNSILGNKFINFKSCSSGLKTIHGEKLQFCNEETCILESSYSCITSNINFNIVSFTLGSKTYEFIIFPLFLLIFVILLVFLEYKPRKPYSDLHH